LAEDASKVASPDLCARPVAFQQMYLSTDATRKSSRDLEMRCIKNVKMSCLWSSFI